MDEDIPPSWKAVATGVWIAAALGAGAMWATLRVADWLHSPYVKPLPTRATERTPVPLSPRSIP